MNIHPYRKAHSISEKSFSSKEKFLNMLNFFKNKIINLSVGVVALILFVIGLVSFIGFIIYDSKNIQQQQRNTIKQWAISHNMNLGSCLDVSGYCECSVSNEISTVIVKVTDNEPTKIFSVIQSNHIH